MAPLALLPHLAGMRVVLLVASKASLRSALIHLVGVAAIAFGELVLAQKRKCGAIVVDDDLRPTVGDVATRAIGAEFSAVRIFAQVA